MAIVDVGARVAWIEAIQESHNVFCKRESARSGRGQATECYWRNSLMLRLNRMWAPLQETSEQTLMPNSEDLGLRDAIQAFADKLLAGLTETAPLDWQTVHQVFHAAFDGVSGSSLRNVLQTDSMCTDMDARRAAVQLCENLFAAVQGGQCYDQLPSAIEAHKKMLSAVQMLIAYYFTKK